MTDKVHIILYDKQNISNPHELLQFIIVYKDLYNKLNK